MTVIVKDDDVQIEKLELGPWPTNAFIVTCLKTRDSLLVDAPAEANKIIERLQGTNPRYILLTHNHSDHVGALAELRSRLRVPLVAHALEAGKLLYPPERLLNDDETILLGNLTLEVLYTPGHTPGSLCLRVGRYLLSGDTIFPGGPGNTRSPDAFRQIVKSITDKIFVLPDDTQVFPSHGEGTILKKEKDGFAVFASRPGNPRRCGDVLWLSS